MEYKLYTSNLIQNNHQDYISQCNLLNNELKIILDNQSSTIKYSKYNIFNFSSTSLLFYQLFKELNFHIRSYIGDDRPLWLQAWLNFHSKESLQKELKEHSHESEYHGYICINPHDTSTCFKKGFEIKNYPGLIYLGPGSNGNTTKDYDHYVKINSDFTSPRITIGLDIALTPNNAICLPSWIPLI